MKRQIVISIFFLIIGILIYLLFRIDNLLIYKWVPIKQIYALFNPFGNILLKNNYTFLNILIYSLPSALWIFSGTLLICSIWSNKYFKQCCIWLIAFYLLAFGFEIMQLFYPKYGTFDIFDIFFSIIFAIFALSINNHKIKILFLRRKL